MNNPPELKHNEHHPAADDAYGWLKGYMVRYPRRWLMHKEALASAALSDNRMAAVCTGTINRLARGLPVSDRYILGLAWTIMQLDNADEINETTKYRIDLWSTGEEV